MNEPPPDSPAEATTPLPPALPFRDWFDAARHNRLALTGPELVLAQEFQYVFISGFHNEMMPLYFWGNIRELRRRGIHARNIHRIHPSSHMSFDTVVDRVANSFEHLAHQNPERLVVVGHSRGACAALAAALRRADQVCDRIEALFLIQGPFGGTAIADYVVAVADDFPENWPSRRLKLARSLTWIERFALRLGWDGGLHDLTHDFSRRFWREAIAQHRRVWGGRAFEVERKAYFIATSVDPERSRFLRSELGRIIQECDGPNDGVVALADQAIEGVGTRLEPLEAAHTDLVWGLHSTPGARNDRRALTQAIIRLLAVRHGLDTDAEALNLDLG
jgi:pimeloyl-ACP methyl ester carboxylesterase